MALLTTATTTPVANAFISRAGGSSVSGLISSKMLHTLSGNKRVKGRKMIMAMSRYNSNINKRYSGNRSSYCSFVKTKKSITSTTTTIRTKFQFSPASSSYSYSSFGADNDEDRIWHSRQQKEKRISNMLVCGDGDLSYSASIAPTLHKLGIHLTATVLESQEDHERVYQNSKTNANIISSSHHHQVLYTVDATKLPSCFNHYENNSKDNDNDHDDTSLMAKERKNNETMKLFDRIQFNFPHWLGKNNNRYNRQLVNNFLQSATNFLTPNTGEIHMALCDGQGGSSAKTMEEWKRSWLVALYAAEHGLLLTHVLPFEPSHDLSSHRGVDRPFKVGENPKLYIFAKPSKEDDDSNIDNNDENTTAAIYPSLAVMTSSEQLQLCCRHELHIELPSHSNNDYIGNDDGGDGIEIHSPLYTTEELVDGDAILNIIQNSVVPTGIRVDVPIRKFLPKTKTGLDSDIVVFLVVYCGGGRPLTRSEADQYRSKTEVEVAKHVSMRKNRLGRMVSRPFPYSLLDGLIKEHVDDY